MVAGLFSFLVCTTMILDMVLAIAKQPNTNDDSCNPVVDMLFVLEKSSNVTDAQFQAQKQFIITLLKKHNSPKGAARVAVLVCDVDVITSTPFTDNFNKPFSNLESNVSTKSEKSPDFCLRGVNFKMKTESRDGVTRIAILLKGSWNWDNIRSQNEALISRQDETVLVVIAIGVREFDSLSSLQTIALREETFFVVSGYDKLGSLAASIARDPCQPISLDLTSESKVTINTTKPPTIAREPCIQVGPSTFKKYVPGFGYTRQRCTTNQTFHLQSCSCVLQT